MKRYFLIAVVSLSNLSINAQNLVPNGDFEQYSVCPTQVGQINKAISWMNPIGATGSTPDYFNQCATNPSIDVPSNVFGFQFAHSGIGYCGFVVWQVNYNNFREYVETSLISPLVANECYYFKNRSTSFWCY